MSDAVAPDNFGEAVKRQILNAFGFESEAELDAAVEEALPGYLAAHAEYEARREAYLAELPGRMEEAATMVTAQLRAQGMLPHGVSFAFAAQEPIVVDYATDCPYRLLMPDVPELTEEQKLVVAKAASARIGRWRQLQDGDALGAET